MMKPMMVLLAGVLSCTGLRAQQPAVNASPVPRLVTPPPKQKFHIYLLMGQSNMVGRDVRSLASQLDDPRLLALNHDDQRVVARDPIHFVTRIPPGQGPR